MKLKATFSQLPQSYQRLGSGYTEGQSGVVDRETDDAPSDSCHQFCNGIAQVLFHCSLCLHLGQPSEGMPFALPRGSAVTFKPGNASLVSRGHAHQLKRGKFSSAHGSAWTCICDFSCNCTLLQNAAERACQCCFGNGKKSKAELREENILFSLNNGHHETVCPTNEALWHGRQGQVQRHQHSLSLSLSSKCIEMKGRGLIAGAWNCNVGQNEKTY